MRVKQLHPWGIEPKTAIEYQKILSVVQNPDLSENIYNRVSKKVVIHSYTMKTRLSVRF